MELGQYSKTALAAAFMRAQHHLHDEPKVIDDPYAHRLLTVPRVTPDAELPGRVIHRTDSDRHSTVLVRTDPVQQAVQGHAGGQADPVSFEQLVMAYLQRPSAAATTGNPAPAAERPGPNTKAVTR